MDKVTKRESEMDRNSFLACCIPALSQLISANFQPISSVSSLLCGQGFDSGDYRADSPAPVSILI